MSALLWPVCGCLSFLIYFRKDTLWKSIPGFMVSGLILATLSGPLFWIGVWLNGTEAPK